MGSLNKVIILGRLGADPELRTAGSTCVANLSVATSESWKDKGSGEKKEKTEWHRCVAWGKTAELAEKYLKKGSEVLLEGKLSTSSYEKDGVTKYSTQIVIEKMTFVGGGKQQGGGRPAANDFDGPPNTPPPSDDDVPF